MNAWCTSLLAPLTYSSDTSCSAAMLGQKRGSGYWFVKRATDMKDRKLAVIEYSEFEETQKDH